MSLQIQLHVPAFIRCLGTLMIPGFCNKSESDCAVHRTQLTVSVSFLYRNTNHNNNDCSSHRLLHYKVGQVQRECVCVWLRRKTLSLSFSSTRMKKVKTALHVNIHVHTHTARSLNVSESRLFSRTTLPVCFIRCIFDDVYHTLWPASLPHCRYARMFIEEKEKVEHNFSSLTL